MEQGGRGGGEKRRGEGGEEGWREKEVGGGGGGGGGGVGGERRGGGGGSYSELALHVVSVEQCVLIREVLWTYWLPWMVDGQPNSVALHSTVVH